MSREAPQWNVSQLRNELESYERTTKAAYERLRAVVYSNKKRQTPIYQNKLELGRLGKRSTYFVALLVVQIGIIGWLGWKNVQLNQEIVALSTTFKYRSPLRS